MSMPPREARSRSPEGHPTDEGGTEEESDDGAVVQQPHALVTALYAIITLCVSKHFHNHGTILGECERRATAILKMFDAPLLVVSGITHNPLQRMKAYVAEGF
jgi:hypothetical protein